jgi:acyl-homoserine lactone acylase PvdQ
MARCLPQLILAIFCLVPAAWSADPLARLVTIYRDNFGVPHIVGETEQAVFFGYGYAQAQDHLERMMLQYRDAQGRRAEVLGKAALGERLEFTDHDYRWGGDYLQRLFHAKRDVTENKDKIDPNTYQVLSAFARGVNEYIFEHRSQIPGWIDSITPEDIEALERSNYLRFYSVHDALQKIQRKAYNSGFGSNHWAISPFRSANGRVIHVASIHMPWDNRFQNYEAHLIVPGKLDVGGISWFGSPFFLEGFNDRITWSATWNRPNISDVYIEKVNPDGSMQYLFDGKWNPIRIEREAFSVRTAAGMEQMTLPLYYTHHGPIVQFDRKINTAYSIKLPNADGVNYSTGMYLLMKARSLSEFQAALNRQLIPRWNFLVSDEKNIFWVHNAVIARRSDGYDWTKPVPGWTKSTDWGPYLPFSDNPQLLNPPTGFVQNCNNPPWLATKHSGLRLLEPARYYLQVTPRADAGEEALNTRGERVFQVMDGNTKFSLDDMKSLALDTYVLAADVIVPLLERAYTPLFSFWPSQRDPRVSRALELLRTWDRRSAANSVAFTYLYFWGKAYENLYSPESFHRFTGYARRNIKIDSWLEQYRARRAFEAARDRMQRLFGKTEVPWGQVNVTIRGGTFPMDGTGLYDVLHPDKGLEQSNGQIFDNDGWGHVMIVMEGEAKEIWSLLPYGESEDPSSPHYNDQTKLHSRRELKQFWFSPQQITDHSESVWGDRGRLGRHFRLQQPARRKHVSGHPPA